MSKVRAKFVCISVDAQPLCKIKDIQLNAVTDGCEENKSFSKYTPSGVLHINISDDTPASEFFEQGKEYYLDFTAAE